MDMVQQRDGLPDGFRPRYGGANWSYDFEGPDMQYPQPTIDQMLSVGLAVPGPVTALYGGAGAIGGAIYGGRQLMQGARRARKFRDMGVMAEYAKEALKAATAFPAIMAGIGYGHDVGGRLANWSSNTDSWQKAIQKEGAARLRKDPPAGHFNYNDPWGAK